MCSVIKISQRKAGSEGGFVLIIAIMAVVVMTAIGFFALTMISGDMMITYRLAAERKAFSAAESGVHAVFTSLNLNNIAAANLTNVQIDPADPSLTYSAKTWMTTERLIVSGFESSAMAPVYQTEVTGRNNDDGSTVIIVVGLTSTPVSADTTQGNL